MVLGLVWQLVCHHNNILLPLLACLSPFALLHALMLSMNLDAIGLIKDYQTRNRDPAVITKPKARLSTAPKPDFLLMIVGADDV